MFHVTLLGLTYLTTFLSYKTFTRDYILGLLYIIRCDNIGYVRRNIQFDIKHGVTVEEVITFLDKVRNDISFSDVRKSAGSGERLEQLEREQGITTLI